MHAAEYWLLLAVVAAAGGWGFARGFRWWRWARLIEDTPTSRVKSAAQGYVELVGTGRMMPGPQVIAPLSKRPCTWWSFTIERRSRNRKGNTEWKTVNRGASDSLFQLEDGSGRCIIDPDGAEVLPGVRDTWYGDSSLPASGPPARRSFLSARGEYRYREARMHDGDALYAIGWFRTETNVPPGALDEEVGALLRQWKRDPTGILRRFDANGDGTLDLVEWEAARKAAHEQVLAERREQAALPGVHLLERPVDRAAPFLLGAAAPTELASRYRRRALGGLSLFLCAAAALGYLLLFPLD